MPASSFQAAKLVAIGGGTGLSAVLSGLKDFVGAPPATTSLNATWLEDRLFGDIEPTSAESTLWLESLSAIVTVSDDGGSSGRLRDELNMLAPGDIRNCMVALSEDSALLSRLFQYRFPGAGALGGHSFGNLFLAALTSVTGDFVEAVRLSSEVLASKGRIFPATLTDVRLAAELADGTILRGESIIGRSHAPIKKLSLEPELCLPLPETIAAIQSADIITIGPGSLFTSILPNLLVAQVAAEIGASPAVKIFVCNLMTQPGETDGFTAHAHLAAVHEYAPDIRFDYVLVNSTPISAEQVARYRLEGGQQVVPDLLREDDSPNDLNDSDFAASDRRTRIVAVDVLDGNGKVRHSPPKLARAILDCYAQSRDITVAADAAAHDFAPDYVPITQ